MENVKGLKNIFNKPENNNLSIVLMLLLMFVIFLIDMEIPTGTNIWVLYIIPISFIMLQAKKKQAVYAAVFLGILFMILDEFLGPQGIPKLNALFNRVLGIIVILIFAYFIDQRKKVLGIIEEQKKQFEKAVMDNPMPIMVKANSGEVVLINKAWADITGYTYQEMQNVEDWIESACTDGISDISQMIKNPSELDAKKNYGEFEVKAKSGEKRIWDFSITPLGKFADGNFISLITANDITDRKKIEEKLINQSNYAEELSDFNFEILESSPYGIATYDETGYCTYVNEAYHTMIGATRTQALFQNFHSLDSWKKSGLYQLALDTIDTGKVHSKEINIISTFGKELWIHCKITPFHSRSKLSLLVTFFDISASRLADLKLQNLYKEKLLEIEERKKAEETLRKLTRAVEQSPVSVVITDLTGKIEYVNPKFTQLTGYKFEEVLGMNPRFLKSGLTPVESYKQLWTVILSGGTWKGEFCNKKKNGEIYWEIATISPIIDEKGVITHFVAVKEDITERKEVEKALQESHEREVLFSQHLLILQEVTNLLSNAVSFDELCRKAVELGSSRLGFDRMSIWFEGKEANTIVGSFGIDENGKIRDERNQINYIASDTAVRKVLSHKEPVHYTKNIPLYNHLNEEIGIGESVIAALWNGSRTFGFICIDNLLNKKTISEHQREILGLYASQLGYLFPRKQAEEELRESEERFRHLADSMPQLVQTANPDGNVDYFNQRVKEFDGISQLENGYWSWLPVIHEEDRQATEEAWLNSITTGCVFEITHRLKKKDGNYRWYLTRGVPIRNSSGEIKKWFSTTTDIHEQKKAEEELERIARELERSNKELEQFAYIASHDLQEPIRMIRSYSQLLDRKYKGKLDNNADDYLKFIIDGASRMQRLISDLLKYARVTTQGQPFEKVDCKEIVNEVLDDLKFKIQEENAEIECGDLPVVNADGTQLRQVFQNLIYNAIKFKKQGIPKIRIRCEKKKRVWIFSVEDNGIGINKEYLERIFVIFQRLHSAEKYPGTGIGLALVKKIIERHGGRVFVESEPGKGSIFYFTLPG